MSAFDDAIAARTIYGEARGESEAGMEAVAWVIWNRINDGRWGTTAAAVCLAPAQFSCWNTHDPNRHLLLELPGPYFERGLQAWAKPRHGIEDPTHGATHYQVIGTNASWSVGHVPVVTIGHHAFFTNVP